jgi:hypothetical protein
VSLYDGRGGLLAEPASVQLKVVQVEIAGDINALYKAWKIAYGTWPTTQQQCQLAYVVIGLWTEGQLG